VLAKGASHYDGRFRIIFKMRAFESESYQAIFDFITHIQVLYKSAACPFNSGRNRAVMNSDTIFRIPSSRGIKGFKKSVLIFNFIAKIIIELYQRGH
jgi:hypothetical protein